MTNNVYIDATGKVYSAASPNSANDMIVVSPRPELVTALNTLGTSTDIENADGITENAVLADGSSNPSGQAGI